MDWFEWDSNKMQLPLFGTHWFTASGFLNPKLFNHKSLKKIELVFFNHLNLFLNKPSILFYVTLQKCLSEAKLCLVEL